MRVRVAASLVLALAGAAVLYVSLQARAAEQRHEALQSAALVGSAAASPRTATDAYLAALAAFRADREHGRMKAGERAAAIAAVQQAIERARAAGPPAAQRSQLENLEGVLEQELARLGGDQALAHRRAAADLLQRAVLDDDANEDAKFNLELLMAQHPKAARKQPQPAASQSAKKKPNGKPSKKVRSPKSRMLGNGF